MGGHTTLTKRMFYKDHEVFLIECDSTSHLLYSPALKTIIRITEKLASKILINNLSDEDRDKDIMAVIELLNHAKAAITKPIVANSAPSIFPIGIGLTKACNLQCLYCHSNAGKDQSMPKDILFAAIEHAFSSAKDNKQDRVGVSFSVGGEPASDWVYFQECVNSIKMYEEEFGIPAHYSITTNGYYGNCVRDFIAKNFNSILLSLDGPPNVQNYQRPAAEGLPSYDVVRESALYYLRECKSFAIRSTVTNYNVMLMPSTVQHFAEEFGTNYELIFEILAPLGRAVGNRNLVDAPCQKDFVEYFLNAKELGLSLGMKVLTSATIHSARLVTSYCAAMDLLAFNVTPEGIVTPCGRDVTGEHFGYAHYSAEQNKFVFDPNKIIHNSTYKSIPEKCDDCFCKWHCAGDCPDSRRVMNRCYMIQRLIKDELEALVSTR
jgi:uncharacterized protein